MGVGVIRFKRKQGHGVRAYVMLNFTLGAAT